MATPDYRRKLTREETLQLLGAAAGAGVGVAAVAFYFGRLWLQRTSLRLRPSAAVNPPPTYRASPAPQRR